MEEGEPSTVVATAAAAESGGGGLIMGGRYVHETIEKINIAVMDEDDEDEDGEEEDHDFMDMVEDPIQETEVSIKIIINRYIQSSRAAPKTLDDTIKRFYVLEGFLIDDTPVELDDLVRDKTVTARSLEKIKKTILNRRYKIIKLALEFRRKKIRIDMSLDLLTWYSDQEDLKEDDHVAQEMVVDDDYDDEEMLETDDDDDETDFDDDDDVWRPALRSSVEALETRVVENKEDLVLMLKSTSCGCRSCGVCLEEFSIDAAAGGISIKTMPCSHFFHSECIVPWLERRHTCPICRYKMPTATH